MMLQLVFYVDCWKCHVDDGIQQNISQVLTCFNIFSIFHWEHNNNNSQWKMTVLKHTVRLTGLANIRLQHESQQLPLYHLHKWLPLLQASPERVATKISLFKRLWLLNSSWSVASQTASFAIHTHTHTHLHICRSVTAYARTNQNSAEDSALVSW